MKIPFERRTDVDQKDQLDAEHPGYPGTEDTDVLISINVYEKIKVVI